MSEPEPAEPVLTWTALSPQTQALLNGKLAGLWGAASDADAFDSWAVDKKQAMLLLLDRLEAKDLWHLIKRVTNVYGEGGVGIEFEASPKIHSTLSARRDFTTRFANHPDTTGGFYEKQRGTAVLHFLYQDGAERRWYVHFDLYSPVHSPGSILNHLRHEYLGKLKPDWRMISKHLNS